MTLVLDMNMWKDSLGADEFVKPILSVIGVCEVRHYLEEFDTAPYDRVILSGTPLKDDEYLNHPDAFKWLKKYDKPVLGICAGMQAMAAAYGAKVEKCQEIGMAEIRTLVDNPLFSGTFKAYELHNYAVKSTKKFITLAESNKCTQAIKHPKKPQYGILFHPEARNIDVMEAFIR
ncbi:MAG: hypothetical protein V1875_03170 [Candidatus Altiarchaeota archaeon]